MKMKLEGDRAVRGPIKLDEMAIKKVASNPIINLTGN